MIKRVLLPAGLCSMCLHVHRDLPGYSLGMAAGEGAPLLCSSMQRLHQTEG